MKWFKPLLAFLFVITLGMTVVKAYDGGKIVKQHEASVQMGIIDENAEFLFELPAPEYRCDKQHEASVHYDFKGTSSKPKTKYHCSWLCNPNKTC